MSKLYVTYHLRIRSQTLPLPLPNLLSPHRIISPILRLKDHAAGLEASCLMVDSHRDLQSGTFATGLQHMLRYLGSILRIALTRHLATANDYHLGRMAMLMYRHIRIRHHHIENALRHVLPVFMSDATGGSASVRRS